MKKSTLLILLFILQGCAIQELQLTKNVLLSDVFIHHNDTTIAYEGYAFDAMLNDTPVIEISNKDKIKSLKGYRDIASVRWQLLKPINSVVGQVKVALKKRNIKEHDIGKILSYEVDYHALTPIEVKTKQVRVEAKTILVHGKPMVYYKSVIERLPVGDYVISLTVRGSENWDRKEIYVEVRDKNVNSFL